MTRASRLALLLVATTPQAALATADLASVQPDGQTTLKPRYTRFMATLAVLGAYRDVDGVPMPGFTLRLDLGADSPGFAGAGTLRLGGHVFAGRLWAVPFQIGGRFDAVIGRVRLGAGPQVGVLVVPRVTAKDQHVFLTVFGVHARFAVDVVRPESGLLRAVQIEVEGSADVSHEGRALFMVTGGPSLRF